MRVGLIILLLFTLFTSNTLAQDKHILKGVTEFRNVVLEHLAGNIQQTELIRMKLDSAGITQFEYNLFMRGLTYISKNKDTDKLRVNSQFLDLVRESKIYPLLSDHELEILVEGAQLSEFGKIGIWAERYPHKLNFQSTKLKEIENLGIEEGDKILLYKSVGKVNSSILLYSFNDLELVHFPYNYSKQDREFFRLMSVENDLTNSTLRYPDASISKIDESVTYDKIIVDANYIMYYSEEVDIKYKFKKLYRILNNRGELILSSNRVDGSEGTVRLPVLEKKLKKAYKEGFRLKEKIIEEGEFVVFRLVKKR